MMKRGSIILAWPIVVLACLVAGCGREGEGAASQKPVPRSQDKAYRQQLLDIRKEQNKAAASGDTNAVRAVNEKARKLIRDRILKEAAQGIRKSAASTTIEENRK